MFLKFKFFIKKYFFNSVALTKAEAVNRRSNYKDVFDFAFATYFDNFVPALFE